MIQSFGYGFCVSPKGSHRNVVLRWRHWELVRPNKEKSDHVLKRWLFKKRKKKKHTWPRHTGFLFCQMISPPYTYYHHSDFSCCKCLVGGQASVVSLNLKNYDLKISLLYEVIKTQIFCCTNRKQTKANSQAGESVKWVITQMNEDWCPAGAEGHKNGCACV